MAVSSLRMLVLASAAGLVCAAGLACAAPPTYAVTGKIAGSGGGWDYASFDPVHRRLYVSRTDGVTAVDVDSGKLTAHMTDGQSTHEPLVVPGGDSLLVSNGATASARLVKTADGSLIADIPTALKPDAAVYDPSSRLAFVMSASGFASLIDPVAKAQVGKIAIGGKLEFAAANGKGRVFVNVESKNEIAVLDVKAKTVSARYPLTGCDSPGGLAYAPGADVLIAACDNKVAKVVAARTGAVLATLKIGDGPDAVIYDAARNLAFIPCGDDGVLEVIAVNRGADAVVVQTLKTDVSARTGALDPKTGKLYLPAATYGPPAVAGGKRVVVPGSFHIVVVSPRAG